MQQGVTIARGITGLKGAAPNGDAGGEAVTLSTLPIDLWLWKIGMQRCMAHQPFGLRLQMLGADNLRKIAGYDFHLLRKKYVSEPCGEIVTHNGDYCRVSWRLEDQAGLTCRTVGGLGSEARFQVKKSACF